MQANLQSNSANYFIALGAGFLSPFLSFGISVKNMQLYHGKTQRNESKCCHFAYRQQHLFDLTIILNFKIVNKNVESGIVFTHNLQMGAIS
jgi:hypothetical protein